LKKFSSTQLCVSNNTSNYKELKIFIQAEKEKEQIILVISIYLDCFETHEDNTLFLSKGESDKLKQSEDSCNWFIVSIEK
jgi:hypothetical protein